MTDPKQEMRARADKWLADRTRRNVDGFVHTSWIVEPGKDYGEGRYKSAADCMANFASSERDRARELACAAVRKTLGDKLLVADIIEAAIRQAFEEER